ncbi:helix-turn-helix transcriptional regulator [Anaerohalosphaeraceae bacterium U12dextr]
MEQSQIDLIDVTELAQKLRISKRQVFRLNSQGRLPRPIHLGGSVRWYWPECHAWIKAGAPNRKAWEVMKGGR